MSKCNARLWRRIVLQIFIEYSKKTHRGDVSTYLASNRIEQQLVLLRLAGVDRWSREMFAELLCRELVITLDIRGRFYSDVANCEHLVSRAQALYIHFVNSHIVDADIDIAQAIEQLVEFLPHQLNVLKSITIETNARCKYQTELPQSLGNALQIPQLASVNVVFKPRRDGRPWLTMAAPAMAQAIVTLVDKRIDQPLLKNVDSANTKASIIVAPMWIDSAHLSLTTLTFTDMDLVLDAAYLVRRCHKTLLRLQFLRCNYNQLESMLYSDEKPVQYLRLQYLSGALSQAEAPSDFGVPCNAFPSLEYVHEAVAFKWQYQAGVVSHLLIDTLMKINLPRVRVLWLRTSHSMQLDPQNLPALENVYYYTQSEQAESLDGNVVVRQLQRLMQMPRLRYLRFHDQLPTANILNEMHVRCFNLEYLDIGMIVLSFRNAVHLLSELKHLHTLKCAIHNTHARSARALCDLGDGALSWSVQLLRIYVVGHAAQNSGLSPVEEIVSRLPLLTSIQVHDRVNAMYRFVAQMGNEQRFAWSKAVADRVSIVAVDMLKK